MLSVCGTGEMGSYRGEPGAGGRMLYWPVAVLGVLDGLSAGWFPFRFRSAPFCVAVRRHPPMHGVKGARLALALLLAGPAHALGQPAEQQEQEAEASDPKTRGPDEPSDPAAYPFEIVEDVTQGTEPASADVTGQLGVTDEDYVPEVFQYRRRGAQPTQRELSGEHRSTALTEFRVIDLAVDPGDTVRAIARVEPAFEKGRRFVAEFWSQEYGRASVIYVNFKPHEKDKKLYLGRGKVDRHHPGGRYNVGSTMITDEHGHKKAYSTEFNPVMRAPDGSPAYFVVSENPAADVTPPTLRSLEILTPEAGVGETIRVEAFAEDNLAGPTQARAVFVSPTGKRAVRADLIGDARRPGRFLGAFAIPEWYEGGLWKVQKVELYDAARNSALLFAATSPVLRDLTVLIAENPEKRDDEAPVLLAVELPQREALASESVPVAALVEDNLSGVDKVYISFQSPSGADLVRVELESRNPPLNRPSLVPQPNVFRGTLKLEEWQERGVYTVSRLNISDRAQNYLNLNPARDEEIRDLVVEFLPGKKERAGAETKRQP